MLTSAFSINSGWRRVAGHTELVSVEITKVGAVVMLVILGPQAWSPLGGAAIGQRYPVGHIDERPGLGEEGNHLPVALPVGQLVVWLADEK